jgi:hypothetical protein
VKRAFTAHLEKLRDWIGRQRHLSVLYVRYNELVEDPRAQADRVSAFLGGKADAGAMAAAVDPSLYRNRSQDHATRP